MNNYFHRKYILFVYILSNVYLSLSFIRTGTLGGDFKHIFKTNPYVMSYSLAIVLLSLSFFCILFNLCNRVGFRFSFGYVKSNVFDFIFLTITILYLINTSVFSAGVAGVSADNSGGNKVNFYFISIFQPVYLIAIYLFYRVENRSKLYYLILILYMIGIVFSGQSSQFMWIGFLYLLYRYNIKKVKGYSKVICFTLLGLVISPFIRMVKFIFMKYAISDSESILTTANDYILSYGSYSETYIIFFDRTLERFQQVSNVQYIFENGFQLSKLIKENDYIPTFVNHWFIKFVIKVFYGDLNGRESIQSILAYHINGLTDWSTQVGFVGYIPLLGINFIGVLAIIIVLLFTSIFLSKLIHSERSYVVELTWLLMIVLLFHGWLVPFMNYFQALIIFISLILCTRILIKITSYH